MSTQELITSICTEQEQSTDQFLELIQQKIEDTIEVRRIELASQMFAESKGECPECGAGKKECECDDEEEDDKEEMDEAVKKDEDPVDRPDVPFAGPYRKTGSVKKDQFGNVIKNRAKHLAKMGMAAAMKKEELERMDENDLALRSLVSTDPKKQPFYKTQKGRDAAAKKNVPALKSTIKSALGRRSKPNLPEEAEQMDEAFVIHKGKHEPGTKSSLEGTHHGVNVKPVYTSKKEAQTHADKINAGRGYKPGDEKSSLYGGVLYQVSPAKSMKEEAEFAEMAPPGAKYERMVKHIKKGYSKDGLTKNEKSIAYATAWKAKNKMDESEMTDTQKISALGMKGVERAKLSLALAAYKRHGDINKLSPSHRTLVANYAEKTGGLNAVSKGSAIQAMKKSGMPKE